jgi:hypothetical protein
MSQQTLDLYSDVIIQINGDKFPTGVGPLLRASGWRGGIWVRYVDPINMVDEYVVEISDGNEATGFLVFPPEGYGAVESDWGAENNFLGQQLRTDIGSVAGASTVTITAGGGRFLFKTHEALGLDGAGVRNVNPAPYTLNQWLFISENGLLCGDTSALLQLAGVATPQLVGTCSAIPHARNGNRVGLDLKF